jgi:predicted ribosomally synthesized peptide with nif11-like leader
MATQEIGRFVADVARDPELRARLEQAKTVDEVVATARKEGYSFTPEELQEEVLARMRELTEEELERVSGGGGAGALWVLCDGSVRSHLGTMAHSVSG